MSWLKPIIIGGLLVLTGCTATPLYGISGTGLTPTAPVIAYAQPTTRIEQVIYDDLRLRLPSADRLEAPRLSVTTTTSSNAEALSQRSSPDTLHVLTVSATATLEDPSGTRRTISRQASANFTTNAQGLSVQEARLAAEIRAARAVAEQLRLAVLAALANS